MAEKQPPTPMDRYRIDAGFVDGEPYVMVTDRLAQAGLRFGLVDAMQMAGLLGQASANLLAHMQAEARKQRDRSLLVAKK